MVALTGWFFLYYLSVKNAFRTEAKDALKEYLKTCIDLSQEALNVITHIEKDTSTVQNAISTWSSSSGNVTSYLKIVRKELITRFNIPLNDEDDFIDFISYVEVPLEFKTLLLSDSAEEDIKTQLNMFRRSISISLNKVIKKSYPAYYAKFPTKVINSLFKNKLRAILVCILLITLISA